MRVENNGIRYYGFEELATAFNVKPASPAKPKPEQIAKFEKKHRCKACGQPLTYIPGTNVMTCQNPKCKGIKREKIDKEGNKSIYYSTSFDTLNDFGTVFAQCLEETKG